MRAIQKMLVNAGFIQLSTSVQGQRCQLPGAGKPHKSLAEQEKFSGWCASIEAIACVSCLGTGWFLIKFSIRGFSWRIGRIFLLLFTGTGVARFRTENKKEVDEENNG
ncbi:MAG TPA: hypothetical protein VGN63_12350 [Flavisolibacter sp.]|jgi:hypothetical protein|nr:hypothetical protein [Flavisolibacter sp.]